MDIVGYLFVSVFIIGISYSLVLQIEYLLISKKATDAPEYRKLMVANYISCFSIAGFLVTFILNVLLYVKVIQSQILTSTSTSIIGFLFLFIFFISKSLITPKAHKKCPLTILK